MKLTKITVENYRSIESVQFDIIEINGSYTYSLLGINESGKSSFLKALSLIDITNLTYPQDFFNDSIPITLKLSYFLTSDEMKDLLKVLSIEYKLPKDLYSKIKIENIEIIIQYDADSNIKKIILENIKFKEYIFSEYTLKDNIICRKSKEEVELKDFDLIDFFKVNYSDYFYKISHHVLFWKSSPEYLLLDEIDLTEFANDPHKVSIPLLNCFILVGIEEENIASEINKLKSSVPINSLQSKLSELVTKHINNVWPDHPISIIFQINNNKISFLIEDKDVKWQPKTTGQRSDGFKQFISFLLTISVENYNDGLFNTILLIDEPETHLHPPAQINLLKELIEITSNKNDNILFFATHSNYLIDKENLERNYKIFKIKNLKTGIVQIQNKSSTYSEVNYEVFNIVTSDYHNELYGHIDFENKELLTKMAKTKKWIDSRGKNQVKDVSISEYIRHSIHHPENILNKKYTEKELSDSIKTLRALKETFK